MSQHVIIMSVLKGIIVRQEKNKNKMIKIIFKKILWLDPNQKKAIP